MQNMRLCRPFKHFYALAYPAGALPYAAATTMRLGEVLAARGDHVRARDTLTQAVAHAEALHMNELATQAATALAQLDR